MKTTKISSKGQITLPASVRRKLNIANGDTLYVKESADGAIILETERQAMERRSSVNLVVAATRGIWKDKVPLDEQTIGRMRESDLKRLADLYNE